MNYQLGNGSNEDSEIKADDNLKYSPSVSSSSLEKLFQMEPRLFRTSSRSPPASPKVSDHDQSPAKDDKIDFRSEISDNVGSSSVASSSQVSDITHESLLYRMSPNRSPPIQTMERVSGFDPNRIPASVFASKPSTPMEWSVASNESLFSIHIGNSSFSRDHGFSLTSDLNKSGDNFRQASPPAGGKSDASSLDLGEVVERLKNIESTEVAEEEEEKEETTANGVSKETEIEEKVVSPGGLGKLPSVNRDRPSDGSTTSVQSFAFPIKKKCAWRLCHCSNGSWAFCYCTWPGCLNRWRVFKCPRCCKSHCSRAFCYCWNPKPKRHPPPKPSSSTLIDVGLSVSRRRPSEQKQQQQSEQALATEKTSKLDSSGKCCCCGSWLSCFSCRSCSCC